MESVKLFDKNKNPLAKTGKAFGINFTEELMRGFTSDFTVAYNDPVSMYLQEDSMFELYGQLFDVHDIGEETGSNNATTVKGTHVGYRLDNYFLPIGYAFVGTVQQVAQDVLNTAVDKDGNKASSEFTVGTCVNKSGSFALNNTQEVTARAAVLSMKAMGAEVKFDNFTLNFPETCGSGHTLTIETGKNLVNIRRTYQKGNGNSYEVEFANTMRIDGSNPFAVGDNCIVINRVRNQVIQKRIMTYSKCDDPKNDKITIGVFVKDSADLTQSMQVDISAATNTANNSVHVGESYNNVKFTHETGFESISADGLMRTFQNGTDGYLIQHKVNGTWVTVWQVTSVDGTTTAYSIDGKTKVVMGGSSGFTTYKSDGNGGWTLTGGQDANGNNMANRLYNPATPNAFIMVGNGVQAPDGGFMFYDTNINSTTPILKIWRDANGTMHIQNDLDTGLIISGKDNYTIASFKKDKISLYSGGNQTVYVDSSGIHPYNGISASIPPNATIITSGGVITGYAT